MAEDIQQVQQQNKAISSMLAEKRKLKPSKEFRKKALVKSMAQYKKMYAESIQDTDAFWAKMGENIDWFQKWDKVCNASQFVDAKHEWFVGGKLNASYNCLDRHVNSWRKNKAAIVWVGEDGRTRTYTYLRLWQEVNKVANVLKKYGVKKGDRVTIYMPMILELPVAMLACARVGAIHSIVFGGFSSDSLKERITDCGSKFLITTDGYYRSGKTISQKESADKAADALPQVEHVLVYKHIGIPVNMKPGRDVSWNEEVTKPDLPAYCEPEKMDAEDPLFILYTSGSTGRPKGVLHTTGGYMVYAHTTFKYIFDCRDEDTFWCTADIGWITGHTYIAYGPLSNGATSLMYEGVPTYPAPDRFWEIVEKYKVNIFYTAPTAIRALIKEGEQWVNKHDLSSLRLLGTVGEPINPEVWMWYYNVVGKGRCPIVDTWWQTETGGILITTLPGAHHMKPSSAGFPFFGIEPGIIKEDGSQCGVDEGGYLIMKKPWPGLMRTVYGQPNRFKETYFVQFPGVYTAGDGCRVDKDGNYWLIGRIDDVLKVSGHRLGTAEIESALVSHPAVAEAAVVGFPHEIKGEAIYSYVILKTGFEATDALKLELRMQVRKTVGPIASPDKIQFVPGLPKTRSGKIMRRILRKVAAGDTGNLGDTSTLADPSVVDAIVAGRQ